MWFNLAPNCWADAFWALLVHFDTNTNHVTTILHVLNHAFWHQSLIQIESRDNNTTCIEPCILTPVSYSNWITWRDKNTTCIEPLMNHLLEKRIYTKDVRCLWTRLKIIHLTIDFVKLRFVIYIYIYIGLERYCSSLWKHQFGFSSQTCLYVQQPPKYWVKDNFWRLTNSDTWNQIGWWAD